MSDWNDYRVKTRQRIVEYGQQAPDTLRGGRHPDDGRQ